MVEFTLQNLPTLFGLGLLTLVAFQLSIYAYNIFLHPLRKYPGPWYCRASNLPHIWYLMEGTNIDFLTALHEKYGEVVRIAPANLSYTNGQMWQDVFRHRKAGQPAFDKHPQLNEPPYPEARNIINSDDVNHARMRRVFANAFSDRSLKLQQPLFTHHADRLVKKLRGIVTADKEAKLNMTREYNLTTFDSMADLTFGEPLGLLDGDPLGQAWMNSILDNLKFGVYLFSIRFYPILERMLMLTRTEAQEKARLKHRSFVGTRVSKRLAREATKPDIWSLVLEKEGDSGLKTDEMTANASTFMLAGTETTATLLSGLTFYLLKTPHAYKKLTEEIRGAFKTEADFSLESLQSLKYFHACIEEALRIYPPINAQSARVVPAGGAMICDQWVGAGTAIQFSHYQAYHDPKHFKDPEKYIPERWLPEGIAGEYAADQREMLNPFSFGPRNCLGKNMAYHEIRLFAAKVLWNFDLELTKESQDWFPHKSFLLYNKGPLWVNARPLQRASA